MENVPAQPLRGWLPEETEKGRPGSCPDRSTAGEEGPRWHTEPSKRSGWGMVHQGVQGSALSALYGA